MNALIVPPPMARPVQRGSALVGVVGDELALDGVDQLAEGADPPAVDAHGAVGDGVVAGDLGQLGGDRLDDDRVLLALVLGVGEQERQQPLVAELGDRPEEGR